MKSTLTLPKLLLIGGFLGAGKTTAIRLLVRHLKSKGHKVAVVTNDQAENLVDSDNVTAEGVMVEEVAGACFCCGFSKLVQRLKRLSSADKPDVILLEPVGSCTDIRATVVEPLERLYGQEYTVGPLTVLVDPQRAMGMLSTQNAGSISVRAKHIYKTQIAEAELVVLTKGDLASAQTMKQVIDLIRELNPQASVLVMSNITRSGFHEFVEAIEKPALLGASQIPEVDYEMYAAGEAEMGWLNGTAIVESNSSFDLDDLVLNLMGQVSQQLSRFSIEPGHVKASLSADSKVAIASIVRGSELPQLSRQSGTCKSRATLTVNARAFADPGLLEVLVRQSLQVVSDKHSIRLTWNSMSCFKPARPVPEHRYQSDTPSGLEPSSF